MKSGKRKKLTSLRVLLTHLGRVINDRRRGNRWEDGLSHIQRGIVSLRSEVRRERGERREGGGYLGSFSTFEEVGNRQLTK